MLFKTQNLGWFVTQQESVDTLGLEVESQGTLVNKDQKGSLNHKEQELGRRKEQSRERMAGRKRGGQEKWQGT